MKLQYYAGIASKAQANIKCAKLKRVLLLSRLPFAVSIERFEESYSVMTTLSLDVFESWTDMESYIRSFVTDYNRNLHAAQDIKKLNEALEAYQ